MNKAELRKHYLQKQRNLDSGEIQKNSELICKNIFGLFDLKNILFFHIFLPIRKNNEIDTRLIINTLRENFPQIKIVIPRSDTRLFTLENILFSSDTELKENEWGILEPIGGEIVDTKKIDLVIVPLLTFDESGNRLGYGKGFYDRFLAECRKDVIKTGISHFSPEPNIPEQHEFDIQLDYCITPEKIWKFS